MFSQKCGKFFDFRFNVHQNATASIMSMLKRTVSIQCHGSLSTGDVCVSIDAPTHRMHVCAHASMREIHTLNPMHINAQQIASLTSIRVGLLRHLTSHMSMPTYL